jgi:hypothetical protein
VDYVKFVAQAGRHYAIRTLELASRVDTRLYLYDGDGQTLLRWNDDDPANPPASRITWDCPTEGTYFVKVNNLDPQTGGCDMAYSLEITVAPITPTPTPTATSRPTDTPTWTPTGRVTSTPTVTPSRTPPSAGDPYEPDDACGSANAISPDGSPQLHTFHVAGDNDWIRFNTVADARYVIEVIHTGPLAEPAVSLHNACSDPSPITGDNFGHDTRLVWTPTLSGPYYLRIRNHEPNDFGADASYSVSVRTVTAGAAIIVGGRIAAPDELQPQITFMTEHAYRTFQQAGYSHDAIYYLSADPTPPAHSDGPSLSGNLAYAIQTWGPLHVQDGAPLYIYLADHGAAERFYLDTSSNVASTEQLDGWLTSFQNQRPHSPVVVIIEACYSGSFITPASSLARAGRVIVTSTDDASPAIARPAGQGGAYFSDPFFDALAGNYDLWNSFAMARRSASVWQAAWIDGNGNGLPYPLDPADEGAGRGLGLGRVPNSLLGQAPYIEPPILPTPAGSQSVTIQIKLLDEDRAAARAWMEVTRPSTLPPSPPPGYTTPISHAERVNLIYNASADRFEVDFMFNEAGLYRFVFQAEDAGGLRAQPVAASVRAGRAVFLPVVTTGTLH